MRFFQHQLFDKQVVGSKIYAQKQGDFASPEKQTPPPPINDSGVDYHSDFYVIVGNAPITDGSGTVIGVIDSGLPNHADLKGQILESANFSTSPTVNDNDGHSTHVCGVLAGKQGGFVTGVAPGAKIIIAKALDDFGNCRVSSLTQSIKWLVERKVDIIVMALGSPDKSIFYPEVSALKKAVRMAYDSNIALFGAVGNSGGDICLPAKWDEVFSVGAIDSSKKAICGYSARGAAIDFCGYGENIFSCYKDGQYAVMTGTSAAVPGVAGVAALVKAQYPGITNADLREKLIQISYQPLSQDWNEEDGWGVPVFGAVNNHLSIGRQGLVESRQGLVNNGIFHRLLGFIKKLV